MIITDWKIVGCLFLRIAAFISVYFAVDTIYYRQKHDIVIIVAIKRSEIGGS